MRPTMERSDATCGAIESGNGLRKTRRSVSSNRYPFTEEKCLRNLVNADGMFCVFVRPGTDRERSEGIDSRARIK